ncbi:MAG: hydroxyacid dehydrogenase, partial [Saprospiraceae bacterium]|nr:hydroxyacid dehydrogenase [Saprospiraceae bacterium]
DRYKTGYGDQFAQEASLEQLFEEAEVLSAHIPYSVDNHYFINQDFLQKFSNDLFLINTARGLVLNTEDLVTCLKSGKVRGAALDVLEYEETSFDKFKLEHLPPAFDYLCQADNVLLSPHIAGWSFESKEKHARVLADKIRALLTESV